MDGSYVVLLAIDFVACATVAVEGLTPPSKKRHWKKPHLRVFIGPETHNPDSVNIIRGLMMEIEQQVSLLRKLGKVSQFFQGNAMIGKRRNR